MGIIAPFISPRAVQQAQPRLSARAPRATDDVSAGYAVGDVWCAQNRVFRCYSAAAGAAIWLPDQAASLAAIPLPGDVVSGLAFGIGTIRLKAAYTSALLDVQRESDSAAATIGMLGSAMDAASADAHAGASLCRITQAYDQSGNALHATATGDTRPLVPPVSGLNGHRGIMFGGLDAYGATPQYLTIPSGLSLTSRSCTVIVYGRPRQSYKEWPLVGLSGSGGGTGLSFGVDESASVGGLASRGAVTRGGIYPCRIPISPKCYALVAGAGSSGCVLYQGLDVAVTSSQASLVTLAGGTIGYCPDIGGTSGPAPGVGEIGAVLIYNRALTAAEVRAVMASLYVHFGDAPQRRGQVVFDGDSITAGANTSFWLSWPEQLRRLSGTDALFYNMGVGGATTGSQRGSISRWITVHDATAPFNDFVLGTGTNDILNGATATEIENERLAYIADLKAGGRTWRDIWLTTVLPRGAFNSDAVKEGHRTTLNQRLRDNAAAWGVKVLDFAAAYPFNDTAVTGNTDIIVDNTHPGVNGYGCMSAIAQRTMNL